MSMSASSYRQEGVGTTLDSRGAASLPSGRESVEGFLEDDDEGGVG